MSYRSFETPRNRPTQHWNFDGQQKKGDRILPATAYEPRNPVHSDFSVGEENPKTQQIESVIDLDIPSILPPLRYSKSVCPTSASAEKEVQASSKEDHNTVETPAKRLSVSIISDPDDVAIPETRFPLTRDTKIYLNLFGEVISCDVKTLDRDPAAIIELLRITQSERANYMIVGAFYRRSCLPLSAKAVIESMLKEFHRHGVPDSELRPAYLFMSGCETDLARLSKLESKSSKVISAHYDSAKTWLQKVFGKADPEKDNKEDKENKHPSIKTASSEVLKTQGPNIPAKPVQSSNKKDSNILEREIQCLRNRNAAQARQIAQLNSSKRKFEDDYYYERNLRRKYQSRMEALEEQRDAARKMERFALAQVKQEISKRKTEMKELQRQGERTK